MTDTSIFNRRHLAAFVNPFKEPVCSTYQPPGPFWINNSQLTITWYRGYRAFGFTCRTRVWIKAPRFRPCWFFSMNQHTGHKNIHMHVTIL